jgi:hypothetical protein
MLFDQNRPGQGRSRRVVEFRVFVRSIMSKACVRQQCPHTAVPRTQQCPAVRRQRGTGISLESRAYSGRERTVSTRYTVALAVVTPPQITVAPLTMMLSPLPVTVRVDPSTVV